MTAPNEAARRGLVALCLAVLATATKPSDDATPPCPICGGPLTPVQTGDWLCMVDHEPPRVFFAREVAA